ncbi:hypothetical protein FRB90_000928 [Tulasnella sp. 427]|nr:hypothetical protein FRB90_000928 [Tulasnella sp. 427]
MCTRARSGRRSSNGVGGGPDQINTKTRTGAGYSRRHGDEDVVIKLTPPGNPPLHGTRLRPGPSQPCLSPSPSASGQVYITPTPQDLIRWKHHQFHLQPPLATSSLLLPSAMNYHHPSMSSTVYECRYCAPGLTSFTDWRPLVMHEACDHIDMLNRIPCPADGCDKNYAQLKYLITHYNIQGYTDPSRASRCRQSHDRHFKCPVTKCDYSNARADLVKQHCRKKHPDIGDISTAQLESEPSPPPPSSSDPFPSPSSSSSSFVFSANPAPPPQVDPEHGLPTSAPPYPRYALAQAAENRRKQMIVELRAAHVALSRLSEDAFDAEVPEYPIKRNGGMVGDEAVGGSPGPSPGRSSSIGSYYSTTPPAGQWTASDLMRGGYAQPTATTPPAMEYVGQQQAWPSAVGRGVGPQQQQQSGYSSLSGFQGQQVHRHRRDYST